MDYHDMLAKLGAGSAHPGGMQATLSWLEQLQLQSGSKVLDVGCGTGRTACLLQKLYNCQVTGIDLRPKMIEKAKQRAEHESANVQFMIGSAEHLPFGDNEFDYCITESVNVFLHVERALTEYWRVLKPQGIYVDIEMATFGPVTQTWRDSVRETYCAKFVPDMNGWKQAFTRAGFVGVRVVCTRTVQPHEAFDLNALYPDTAVLADADAYRNPKVIALILQNSNWLERNHGSLLYGVFTCLKPGSPECGPS